MPYELFESKITALCRKHGLDVRFSNDTDKGLYTAELSSGYTITGNRITPSVTFRSRNHCFMAAI